MQLYRHMETVRRINELEPAMRALSDSELKAKTHEFRARLAAGVQLDALLPEAFAVVREASCRVLGLRHFDVQLVSFITELWHDKWGQRKHAPSSSACQGTCNVDDHGRGIWHDVELFGFPMYGACALHAL